MIKKWLKLFKKNLLSSRLFGFFQNIKDNKKYIKDNFEDFGKEEKREIKELFQKKESFSKFFKDSLIIFKDYFIPTESNDNRPKILRSRQLTIIAIFLLVLKVSLALYIFTIYQEKAEMSVAMIDQVLMLTNESRVANGAPALNLNVYLSQAAQIKAEDMLINDYFSHTSPDGRKPWDFVNRREYPYVLVGENLAMNFITSNDVHSALMASASHQKNILNAKYSDIGIYIASGKINGQETNILVEIFAYKKQSPEPEVITKLEPMPEPKSELEPKTAPQIIPASIVAPVVSGFVAPIEPPVLSGVVKETPNVSILGLSSSKTEEAEVETESLNITPSQPLEDLSLVSFEPIYTEEIEGVEEIEELPQIIESDYEDYIDSESSLATEPVLVDLNKQNTIDKAARAMNIARLLYVIFLLVLIILLIINILVRISVQHQSVIFQTILLLILIATLVLFDFDFMVQLRNAAGHITLF